ncbi:uncharacterized protein LOC127806531 isoform X2 [Diospyros lotus]|nr:uncharacterized protein LOC127806531 isoform X2 [Diospyros lotus]
MMDEIRRKELLERRIPMESCSFSRPLLSQKGHKPSFSLVNSVCTRPSVSGVEIDSSPVSCTEGNDMYNGQSPFQNGFSSKDCEILESRPSKVRKMLFDLELPADECIDSEESNPSLKNKISDVSSCPPLGRHHRIAPESSVKLNLDISAKIDCDTGTSSRSGYCCKSSIKLADLNEPIHVEEPALPASLDFVGCAASYGETKDQDPAGKFKSQFLLGLPKEILQNSHHVKNIENGREWSAYVQEARHCKTYPDSAPQGVHVDKALLSSELIHTMPDKTLQPFGILRPDRSKEDVWSSRTVCDSEHWQRSCNPSGFNHPEPVVASNLPSSYPFIHSSDLDHAWSVSISTWGKPSVTLAHKLTSSQANPPSDSAGFSSRSSKSSAQSHEIFGDKLYLHSRSGSTAGLGSGLSNPNGLRHGSSSASKDIAAHFPLGGYDYLNCCKDHKVASECSINYGPGSYLKGSDFADVKLTNDMKPNPFLSKCLSNEVVPQRGLEIRHEERKCEDHLKALPWFKAKPAAGKNEGTNATVSDSRLLSTGSETVKILEVGAKSNELSDCLVNRKILGFPIFGNPCTPKNESSSLVSASAFLQCTSRGEDIKNVGKVGLIDINMACDPESSTELDENIPVVDECEKKVTNVRTHIDLNSLASDDEATLAPSIASTSANLKIAVEIDLEAPPCPEIEEGVPPAADEHEMILLKSAQLKPEQPQDEDARAAAAEAIVAMSSCAHLSHVESTACRQSEAPADALLWLAEVVSSHSDCPERNSGATLRSTDGGDNEVPYSDEIDSFELMTLNLIEIKEEEFMPRPLAPRNREAEETRTAALLNRPRKGQWRRGRQRRNFQRDILPGLASLSRHEVTEDLQTFGGMMSAAGFPWHSGLTTRRNGARTGGGRGRRRSVVADHAAAAAAATSSPQIPELSSIEVGLADQSPTGWGKTPRRPRRQRCPAAAATLN